MGIKQAALSSIGQKVVLATSGLAMFLVFLVPHMGGNVLFLFGPDLYNSYAEHLHKLVPLLIAVEILLLGSISIHMAMAYRVVRANRRAHGWRITQRSSRERSLAARLMPLSGIMIFAFVIKHLLDFKFREKAQTDLHGLLVNDVYGMVLARFQGDLVHTAVYLLFMVAVGLHLSHALQSSLQTYGLFVPREGSRIKLASAVVGWGMAATFAIVPIVAFTR